MSSEKFIAQMHKSIYRQEGDLDLVAYCKGVLEKHLPPEKVQVFLEDSNITKLAPLTTELQRSSINMFLNSQYSTLKGDITTHRDYILRHSPIENWQRMFEVYHAPTLARLGLPVRYEDVIED